MIIKYLELLSSPTKLVYIEGQELDLTGCHVRAMYDNDSYEDITASMTVTPSPLTARTTSAVLHYIGDSEEEENHEFTIAIDGISVYSPSAWKFLDGDGLAYFYNKLLHTFIPKSDDESYLTEAYYDKVMAYDEDGRVGYSEATKSDADMIKDISTILPDTEDKTFENLVDYIVAKKEYVNDEDVITSDIIDSILDETYNATGSSGT